MNQFWSLIAALIASLTGQPMVTTDPVPSASPSVVVSPSTPTPTASTTPSAAEPLAGKVVVIDPGHQLGNGRHTAEINRLVDAGQGQRKACNTTGTSTNAGFPEATFTWQVAQDLTRQLKALGARVVLTRHANSENLWGPCVDVRGRLGNAGYAGLTKAADVKVSIHGDGAAAADHGFHLIVATKPAERSSSDRLAELARSQLEREGFTPANYVGVNGIDHRGDLGTLNLSDIPTVLLEAGNMRNAADAAQMTSAAGRQRIATALCRAIEADVVR